MIKSGKNKGYRILISFTRFKYLTIFIILLLLLTGYFNLTTPTASAAGLDAEFNSIDLRATPRIQGMGGEITITVQANFFGGCCYHLYAYDVRAELEVPGKVNITSPLPDEVKEVDAEGGGHSTSTSFRWKVTSNIPGDYELNVTVSTRNCGSLSDSILINFTSGASISNPEVYPHHPSLNEDVLVTVEAKIGREDVEVDGLTLFTIISEEEYDLEELSAKLDTIYMTRNSENNNEQDHTVTFGLKGDPIQMQSVNFTEDKWRTTVPGFSDEGEVYYWFVVKTSDGKNTTSGIYHLKIEDLEKRDFIINSVVWLTIFGIIFGIIIIFLAWSYMINPTKKSKTKKGFLNLGGKFYEEPYHPITPKVAKLRSKWNTMRFILIILFLIIAIILLIWAIYSNLFEELFVKTLEG